MVSASNYKVTNRKFNSGLSLVKVPFPMNQRLNFAYKIRFEHKFYFVGYIMARPSLEGRFAVKETRKFTYKTSKTLVIKNALKDL